MARAVWHKLYGAALHWQAARWSHGAVFRGAGPANTGASASKSDLEVYFDNNLRGPGIWKWRHYFPIYERHFSRFRNRPVRILEIGIYSGGSLGMWQKYFGPGCHIIGLDIEPACRAYAAEGIQVEIGDQSDRGFWRQFRERVPPVDIIIDDGGHLPMQQRVTLEELLGHLNPGGVYLCEDITGEGNPFGRYIDGISRTLDGMSWGSTNVQTNAFQAHVASITRYPFVCVIEVNDSTVKELVVEKHGTEWQPFL
jgi:SAM-dependent methyltransferase